MNATTVVTRMINGWERCDVSAIVTCFAEKAIWTNMPRAPVEGRVAIAAAIEDFLTTVDSAAIEIHNQWEVSPTVVINERTERFRLKDGKQIIIPVMGVFETDRDLILAWRDYFDLGAMNV